MRRTTLVSAEAAGEGQAAAEPGGAPGTLKLFFSYAPCSGATAAMLDEARGLAGSGRDVFIADEPGQPLPFDLDQLLARSPDVAVLENLAFGNPPGSRNRTRYQDAEELLRHGVDVFATLRVADLQSERERAGALGAELPPEPVPDRVLYGAGQLEFVDIDPAELAEKARAAGRQVPGPQALNELRVLALRCVSEYASSLARASAGDVPEAGAQACVAAYVEDGVPPARVILEARRLAAPKRARVEAVCVRDRPPAEGEPRQDGQPAELEQQVAAMGLELVTLLGDDAAQALADYAAAQGVSDVVMGRRPPRGLAERLAGSPAERVARALPQADVHLVASEEGRPARRRPVFGRPARVRWQGAAAALALTACAYGAVRLLQLMSLGDSAAYVLFTASALATAAATRSYRAAALACALGLAAADFYFVRPYLSLAVDHRASVAALLVFAAVEAAGSAAIVRYRRAARRSQDNERRTQLVFDLGRGLRHAGGEVEAVDGALSSVASLFGRSAAIFLEDPFSPAPASGHDRRAPVVRPVEGDVGEEAFARLTEQAVAHWVFENRAPAGRQTDTHGESDILHLPLLSPGGLEGVLCVSARDGLGGPERSLLDQVADQVALALERQSLVADHRADRGYMRADGVRGAFSQGLLRASSAAAGTVHALADLLASAPEDDREYIDALARAASEEAARSRLMCDRVLPVLESPLRPRCDVRKEVARAVDEVREGLSGKVIDFRPGDETPPLEADPALVHAAAKFLLEASAGYVGPRGIVQVSVEDYPDRVRVTVADNRAPDAAPPRSAAFEGGQGGDGAPTYEEARAAELLGSFRQRAAGRAFDSQAPLRALCRSMRLPEAAARQDGEDGAPLNRQRVLRFDRLEYGLYMAALAVEAHGGTIRQRYRLGGGAVATFTLPRQSGAETGRAGSL